MTPQLRRRSAFHLRMPASAKRYLPRRRALFRFNTTLFTRAMRHRRLLWIAAAVVVFILIFTAVLERRVAPQVQELAGIAAEQQAAEAIAEAVEQVLAKEQVTYERLVEQREENGVKSMQANAAALNLLRTKINRAVEEAVRRRRAKLRLPLGALMGSQLFSGSGPGIYIPLAMTGTALSDIRSDISGAGVNQTMHRIVMDLEVTLAVILPGGAKQTQVKLTVCLAETVIVGNVPNGMGIITQK